jgi:hypothetical protein
VLENQTRTTTALKDCLSRACYVLQIDRRGAIADRITNVKFTPITAEKLAPIRAINPELMPGQLSSAELTRIHRS